mgnify:FL=1
MENQNTNSKFWRIALIASLAIVAYGSLLIALKDTNDALKEANEKLQNEQSLKQTCNYKVDSLSRELTEFSKHKTLNKAMVRRDEANSQLPHKIGQAVYLKRDSSRVIIEDIISGGDKYDYYVRYKVLHKDNHAEEVKPEMVY